MKYSIAIITILLLFTGCDQPTVTDKDNNKAYVVEQTYIPPPPKKRIKLKEINDTNFNAAYMYPEDSQKKEKEDPSVQIPVMNTYSIDKQECIAMISQEKFDKYTTMFGSEAASIKRCKMLKATR